MGKLKNFEIIMKESATHNDAAYIQHLENENKRLTREINTLIDENDALKNEIQALKNFIIKFAEHAADVYAEDVVESVRLQKAQNYKNDPYLNY